MMLFDSTPDGWSKTTLGEICSSSGGGSIQTGPFGSQLHASDYVSEGIPSIMPANITGGRVREDGIARITESDADRLSKYLVQEGDIVYSRRGDVEKCAIITESESGWLCGTGCLRVRVGRDVADSLFVFYFLSHPESKAWISRHAVGATMPNLNTGILSDVPFLLPSSMEQKAIAQILGTLDDKIELNQKMNQTLEDSAKAIFKSWFVDFDPVRAKMEGRPTGLPPEIDELFPDELVDSEIPKGWGVAPLDQIGNFRNGLALQKYPAVDGEEQLPVVKIAQLRKGSTDGDDLFASGVPSNCIIKDGDYVFSWSGSLMAKYWVGGKGALNQHLFKVEEKTQPLWFIASWVEQFMPEFQSIAESKATTMGHIKREHLKQAICVIPSQELVHRSSEVIPPLIKRSILSQQESKVLSELRDTLLPKLISGELRIPDAEKFLDEAGI